MPICLLYMFRRLERPTIVVIVGALKCIFLPLDGMKRRCRAAAGTVRREGVGNENLVFSTETAMKTTNKEM